MFKLLTLLHAEIDDEFPKDAAVFTHDGKHVRRVTEVKVQARGPLGQLLPCVILSINSATEEKPPLREALIEFLRGYGARIEANYGEMGLIYYGDKGHEYITLEEIECEVNRDE